MRNDQSIILCSQIRFFRSIFPSRYVLVGSGAAVCLNCGVAAKNNGGDLAGQDKTVMILICLFLGGLGIHNFMMGETKKGVFKIIMSFCCGIGGILALIDLIKIAMGTYVVNPDKLV